MSGRGSTLDCICGYSTSIKNKNKKQEICKKMQKEKNKIKTNIKSVQLVTRLLYRHNVQHIYGKHRNICVKSTTCCYLLVSLRCCYYKKLFYISIFMPQHHVACLPTCLLLIVCFKFFFLFLCFTFILSSRRRKRKKQTNDIPLACIFNKWLVFCVFYVAY